MNEIADQPLDSVLETIRSRRTIRCFQNRRIDHETLLTLVDHARLYPSAGNLQPIRFALVSQESTCDRIFEMSKWAMYLPQYVIANEHRPTAYIVLLHDKNTPRSCLFDAGAAASTLMLAAQSIGLGSCCLGSCPERDLLNLINLGSQWTVDVVIALGYPAQKAYTEPLNGTFKYHQQKDQSICVPKYSIESVTVFDDSKHSPHR